MSRRAKDVADINIEIERARAVLRVVSTALESPRSVNVDDVRQSLDLIDSYLDDTSNTACDIDEKHAADVSGQAADIVSTVEGTRQ